MIMPPPIDTRLQSTRQRESVCMAVAASLHALALLWNPIMLKSHWQPAHDFVTVDIVEQPAPGGSPAPEAPKRMGLMDTLKDMLLKPKTEEIAHIAPEPLTHRVAAPIQPALKERVMPRPIATAFQPRSTADDLAMANAPNQIQTQVSNRPLPPSGPALQTKAFGGIRAKDLPFQVGTDEALSGGGAVVPIAVGRNSAKAALNYGGASLQESNKKPILQGRTGYLSGQAEMNSLGAGSASTIQISGTGGTGNAPTGAPSGSVLQDRAGSGGGGGLVNRGLFGSGSGRGGGIGSGIAGMPGAAAQLEQQLDASTSSGKGNKKAGHKAFELAGPLTNRPIMKKVIPQYPAWAEERGIIGSVRLYFTVTAEGMVRSNIRVTKTTGYPELDELAVEALKKWQFATLGSTDEGKGEWGIITFNFALSS